MEARSLARSVMGLRPWVSRVAQNEVIDHFRGQTTHLRWLKAGVDVQELPPDPASEGEEAEVRASDPTAPPRPVEEMSPRVLSAAPTASVVPPEPFNNADPTQPEQDGKKPQRLKP